MASVVEDYAPFPGRFVKVLVPELRQLDRMSIPLEFNSTFAEVIPDNVRLLLGNGEEVMVGYIKGRSMLVGMSYFFKKFDMTKDLFLVFEYSGGEKMGVCALSGDCCCEAGGVSITDGGSKVMKIYLTDPFQSEKLVISRDFSQRYLTMIPEENELSLLNGRKFKVHYEAISNTFHGLEEFFLYTKIRFGEILVLTYNGQGKFDVLVFQRSCMEKKFAADNGSVIPCTANFTGFKLLIRPSHLIQNGYGVYVHRRYRHITNLWKHGDYLTVHQGGLSWCLQIRKKKRRVTFHDGWVRFMRDLKLVSGELLVFCLKDNPLEFDMFSVHGANF